MGNSIEKDLRTLVLSFGTVTSYIGTGANARLYWTSADDKLAENEVYPYIVYFTVFSNGTLQYIGTRSAKAFIQFSVFHTHPYDGLDLANNLFDGLSAYHGTPSSKLVYFVTANGPQVVRDPDYDNLYHYVVDAAVRYER